ncbi:hypothetical protein [Fastidiosibacter lacustris]|uniref:hypothetical protein n=1 Tax=Fastidiosibacter lacustris TaxID=2056695 RepID=UPI000E353C2A|nr:hypothetical protein [Fastidiosibacter lacustris]
MDIDEELQQKKAELQSIRASINKALANAHIASYGAAGNTANYRDLKNLRVEESQLAFAVKQLELIKIGKNPYGIVTTSFRWR